MYTDLFGKQRYKINLHTHTTLSDGKLTPAETVQCYRAKGYDALALTDHWFYGEEQAEDDFLILSGIEYNIGGGDCRDEVYHIVGLGCRYAPSVTLSMNAQQIVDGIRAAGGLAVLAHPAWSLNTPEQILRLKKIDATEIYNSVSGFNMSRRPDSGLIVDMIASRGCVLPLIAADDTHFYTGDECMSWIMLEASDLTREAILPAIRAGKFYATQGPEIHLYREGDDFVVRCSPVQEIVFLSNVVYSKRVFTGEGLTESRYTPRKEECFIRAEVTDKDGKRAWSNIIVID